MSNINKVTDYVIGNAHNLTAAKIQALATVIHALGGEQAVGTPNEVPDEANDPTLLEDQPFALHELQGFQINNGPVQKTQIIKT